MIYDVKSRWNSTYCMINSSIALREIIENLFSNKYQLNITQQQVKKLTKCELTSDDWHVLSVLLSILKPFYLTTKTMSGRRLGWLIIYLHDGGIFYRSTKKETLLQQQLKQLLLKEFTD